MDRKFFSIALALAAFVLAGPPTVSRAAAAEADGVAFVILYDNSGSMNSSVRDSNGQSSPKRVIARRALNAVVKQVQTFAQSASGTAPKTVHAGLYLFSGESATPVIPLGPFDPKNIQRWASRFPKPSKGTPLGKALETGCEAVLKSPLSRKHVLVITDGENTAGPDPERLLPAIQKSAEQQQTRVSVHCVAFDVDATVFSPLKKLGVTVVSAADEPQLHAQLEFILEKRILLEDEEPPKKK